MGWGRPVPEGTAAPLPPGGTEKEGWVSVGQHLVGPGVAGGVHLSAPTAALSPFPLNPPQPPPTSQRGSENFSSPPPWGPCAPDRPPRRCFSGSHIHSKR